MKLNLGCGKDVRQRYLNIDLLPSQLPSDIYKQGDIQSLDWITEDNTVEEIIALNCLQYINLIDLKDTLQNWIQKLQPNGILKIQISDVYIMASAFVKGQLNLNEFAHMIFGFQNLNDEYKSVMDSLTLHQLLEELGLTVEVKRYDGMNLYIEAKKK